MTDAKTSRARKTAAEAAEEKTNATVAVKDAEAPLSRAELEAGDRFEAEQKAMWGGDKRPYEPKKAGDRLFDSQDIPREMIAAAQKEFGAEGKKLKFSVARENGDYKGKAFVGENYIAQKIEDGDSIVLHRKSDLELVSQWHKADPRRVHKDEIAIHYTGKQAKVYPYDAEINRIEKSVGSMKKYAKALGLDQDGKFAEVADKVREAMKDKVIEKRRSEREANQARKQQVPQPQEKARGERAMER